MRQICKFCKTRDIQPVVEGLATDLHLAIQTGVIADTGIVPEYNHIDDPLNIHGRVGDAFDAIEAQKKILNKGRITPLAGGTASPTESVSPASSTPTEG